MVKDTDQGAVFVRFYPDTQYNSGRTYFEGIRLWPSGHAMWKTRGLLRVTTMDLPEAMLLEAAAYERDNPWFSHVGCCRQRDGDGGVQIRIHSPPGASKTVLRGRVTEDGLLIRSLKRPYDEEVEEDRFLRRAPTEILTMVPDW